MQSSIAYLLSMVRSRRGLPNAEADKARVLLSLLAYRANGASAYFDMQDRIPSCRPALRRHLDPLNYKPRAERAHLPFILVHPYVDTRILRLQLMPVEEMQRALRRDNLHFHIRILGVGFHELKGHIVVSSSKTWRSAGTMRGALIDATLPVVIRTTCR